MQLKSFTTLKAASLYEDLCFGSTNCFAVHFEGTGGTTLMQR
jgi:hypothetical protein